MKFKEATNELSLDEVIDMRNQKLPDSWNAARNVWNKLANLDKVYPTDKEGFISFERFYESFVKENGKEPTVNDAINLYLKKSPQYSTKN